MTDGSSTRKREGEGVEPPRPPVVPIPDLRDPKHLVWLSVQLGHAHHYIERLEARVTELEARLPEV